MWAADDRLSAAARAAVNRPDAAVYVSIATVWEIAIKRGLNKLDLANGVMADLRSGIALARFRELPIKREHAIEAGMMQIPHKDPFDRLFIAQAQLEGLSLVSNERLFDRFGVIRIWD